MNDLDRAAREAMVAIQRWREAGGHVSLESVRRANDKLIQRAREPRNDREAFAIAEERVDQETADDLERACRMLARQRQFENTQPGVRYPACNGGPCEQGRKMCPSPAACRLSERRPKRPVNWHVLSVLFGGLAFWIAVAVGIYFIWWRN